MHIFTNGFTSGISEKDINDMYHVLILDICFRYKYMHEYTHWNLNVYETSNNLNCG